MDASIVVAALVDDEDVVAADRLIERVAEVGAVAPSLFWHELRAVLLLLERKKRLAAGTAETLVRRLRALDVIVSDEADDASVLRFARAHDLTAYDAAYAALAVKRSLPLATLDKALLAAGQAGAFRLWSPSAAPPP